MSAQPVVSVFGGSIPEPGSAHYEQAQRLGKLLAQAGYITATGGYTGVMEAVSRGANEAGGHVIGVTCDRIEQTYDRRKNRWVIEQVHYKTLGERLRHLVEQCDAAIAMPGGTGTLSEVAYTWSLIQTGEIDPKPLVVVGERWRATIASFLNETDGYINDKDRALIQLARDVDEAVKKMSILQITM